MDKPKVVAVDFQVRQPDTSSQTPAAALAQAN
jgi:hypothetical protein